MKVEGARGLVDCAEPPPTPACLLMLLLRLLLLLVGLRLLLLLLPGSVPPMPISGRARSR